MNLREIIRSGRRQSGHVLLLAVIVLVLLTGITISRVHYYANQCQAEGQLSNRFVRQAQRTLSDLPN